MNIGIGVSVVFGVAFTVFYIFLASQVRAGKNWARVVTFVLAGLGIVGLITLLRPEPALTRVFGLISAILDIALIFLLAQRTSADFFTSAPSSPPGYGQPSYAQSPWGAPAQEQSSWGPSHWGPPPRGQSSWGPPHWGPPPQGPPPYGQPQQLPPDGQPPTTR